MVILYKACIFLLGFLLKKIQAIVYMLNVIFIGTTHTCAKIVN